MFNTEGEIEYHDINEVTDQDFRQFRGQVGHHPAGDFLASIFTRRKTTWDLKILEGLSFLRLLERPKQILLTFPIFGKRQRPTQSRQGTGRSPQSSPRWMNWGIMSNGRCLTVRTSKSRKTENGFIIGDSRRYCSRFIFPLRGEEQAQLILKARKYQSL